MGERRPGSVRVLKRTDFSSHGENPGQIERIRPKLALSGALRAEQRRATRRFHHFSKKYQNMPDWVRREVDLNFQYLSFNSLTTAA